MLEEQKKRENSRSRQKLREDRMRQISEKKIQEKEAEELRDNKGTEKTEKNGLNFFFKKKKKKSTELRFARYITSVLGRNILKRPK